MKRCRRDACGREFDPAAGRLGAPDYCSGTCLSMDTPTGRALQERRDAARAAEAAKAAEEAAKVAKRAARAQRAAERARLAAERQARRVAREAKQAGRKARGAR